jgi:hypothetical protein
MSVQIDNLTPYQVELLNIMWEIDDETSYLEWYDTLELPIQLEVDTLQNLVILEVMDQMLTDLSQARQVLEKFML